MGKLIKTGGTTMAHRTILSLMAVMMGSAAFIGSGQAQDLPPGADPASINEELRRRQEALREITPTMEQGDVTNAQSFDFDPVQDTGVSFTLNTVDFSDSAFLSQQELMEIAADYIGRDVTFTDLNELVQRVNALYDAGGYLTARAMLAPQRIENGAIKVTLVEGVIEDFSVSGGTYYKPEFVSDRISLPHGSVVDLPALEMQLLRFNRLNNANLLADLKPGDEFGTTDVILLLQEPKRNQLDLFVDNNGFESTGEFEGGAIGRRFGVFSVDDQFSGFIVGAGGSLSGSASYSRPIGKRGIRAGLTYVRGRTEVINGPFQDLSVEGDSDTIGINTSFPMLFRRGKFVGGDVSLSRTTTQTTVDTVETSDTEIMQAEAGINADFVGTKNLALFRTSALVASAEENLFDDTRDISLLRGGVFLSRQLTPKSRAVLDFQWQHAFDDDLPGTLEFQLGGANSVRAFDPGTVAGDSGYFAKFQLDREISRGEVYSMDLYGFYDMGEVKSLFPTVNLSAAGIGARISRGDRASFSASIAVPVEDGDLPEQSDVRAFVSMTVRAF